MTEVIIKFKDRNRSDLKLKVQKGFGVEYCMNGLLRIPLATKESVVIWKVFSVDIIEEMTEITREDEGDLK